MIVSSKTHRHPILLASLEPDVLCLDLTTCPGHEHMAGVLPAVLVLHRCTVGAFTLCRARQLLPKRLSVLASRCLDRVVRSNTRKSVDGFGRLVVPDSSHTWQMTE